MIASIHDLGIGFAVWCNDDDPANIVVYGLAISRPMAVTASGWRHLPRMICLTRAAPGLRRMLASGNGTISASMDEQGNFFVAWNGGQFNATGQGDFTKQGQCSFSE